MEATAEAMPEKVELTGRELALLREKFTAERDLAEAIRRAEGGEPLAYIIGEWYFYGLTFKLNSDCLIPRPDTEHIVEATVKALPQNGCFTDLCSGSGCIAISVLVNRPDVRADAVELAENAHRISVENAVANGVADRFNAANDDIFTYTAEKKYHCIVSNPPYIRTNVISSLDASVKEYEPTLALDGGEDGMRFYRHILSAYRVNLERNGCFILEIGYDQREDIIRLSEELGYTQCAVTKDYGGNDRVAIIRP
ncbi:MAG: peptide chain release factor N(5)-glutamine methyltransferase [Clostridia bacterium]|nr:peptide chain release factor N(5)-glutamine methyltransferase [Clostridia bacterium]